MLRGVTMRDVEETRQQTVELIQDIQQSKAEVQHLCRDLRRQIWENKKLLDNHMLSQAERVEIEDILFENMEMLKETEDSLARHDENIADLRYSLQRLDVATESENTAAILFGAFITVAVIAFVMYLLLR